MSRRPKRKRRQAHTGGMTDGCPASPDRERDTMKAWTSQQSQQVGVSLVLGITLGNLLTGLVRSVGLATALGNEPGSPSM